MRLTRQKRPIPRRVLNLPAMIDVVMLILIFFMVTSSFNRPEQHVDADVTAAAGAGLEPADFEPIEVAIRTEEAGQIFYCDGRPCNDIASLKQQLSLRRAIADVEVIIKSDDTIVFDEVVRVLDLCYSCNFTKVGFAVEE